MNSVKLYLALLVIGVSTVSCFDDHKELFKKTQIEFEDAVLRARATGEIFPIINLERASGSPAYQVNLVGKHLAQPQEISYSLDEVPARLLDATTIRAVEGVHFTLNGNSITFPEQVSISSFSGFKILSDFPARPGMTALFIIKLDGNEIIEPAENFRRLGFRINLN